MSPPITFFTPGNTNKIKALEGKKPPVTQISFQLSIQLKCDHPNLYVSNSTISSNKQIQGQKLQQYSTWKTIADKTQLKLANCVFIIYDTRIVQFCVYNKQL